MASEMWRVLTLKKIKAAAGSLTPHALRMPQVIREVYLPQSGLWLSDYPFVDRSAFLDLSLAVERSRQREEQAPPGPDLEGT
jgi:hypothetical protein